MRARVLLLVFALPLLAQDADDPPAFSIAGRVARPDGKAAEALVTVWDALATDRALGQARTDEQGAFTVDVPRTAAVRREHPFGAVRIVVHEPGLARAQLEARAGAADLVVTLAPAKAWSGTVKARGGEPLPGAPVVARQGGIHLATTTDEDGRFSFDDLGDAPTRVTADAGGYRAATIDGGALAFELDPVPVVKGQVVDADSLQPLAGVYVVSPADDVAAETGDDGRFSMELDGGRGVLALYLDGYAITRAEFSGGAIPMALAEEVAGDVRNAEDEAVPFAEVTLDPGFGPPRRTRADASGHFRFGVGLADFAFVRAHVRGHRESRTTVDPGWRPGRVRVKLEKGRAVEGQVLRDGEPVLGAAVTFFRRAPRDGARVEVARAYAGPDGKFARSDIPPDATGAAAEADGWRTPEVPVEAKLWLRLEKDPAVRGVVRDGTGRGVAGATVAVESRPEEPARTGEDGSFELGGVPAAGARIAVFPRGAEYVGSSCAAVPGDAVALTVERRRGTHAVVVRVAGRRAQDARVELAGDGWRWQRWLAPDEDEVRFDGAPAATLRLRVGAPGFQDAEREVVVGDAAETRVRIELPRAGTVRLLATKGATVVILTLEGEPAPARSIKLEDGAATLAGFGPGRYRFLSRAPNEAIVVRDLEAGEKDAPCELDLIGGPASSMRVRVVDTKEQPVRGASIDLVTEGGFVFRTGAKTDDNGEAELTRLILGRVWVVARDGERRAERSVEIAPGSKYEEILVLE